VFLQMLMHQGRFNGAQLLRTQTVAMMGQNQIGDIGAGLWKTTNPQLTNDLDLFPVGVDGPRRHRMCQAVIV